MWKVGLSSSSSCAPGFANLFVFHQRKNVYSSFVARAKWVTQTQMEKQAFFQQFLDFLVLEYCLLCLWGNFSQSGWKWPIIFELEVFQMVFLCIPDYVAEQLIKRFLWERFPLYTEPHTCLSDGMVIGVLSSSLCFLWLCVVQALFSFSLPWSSMSNEHSPFQWGFTWRKSHELACTL